MCVFVCLFVSFRRSAFAIYAINKNDPTLYNFMNPDRAELLFKTIFLNTLSYKNRKKSYFISFISQYH